MTFSSVGGDKTKLEFISPLVAVLTGNDFNNSTFASELTPQKNLTLRKRNAVSGDASQSHRASLSSPRRLPYEHFVDNDASLQLRSGLVVKAFSAIFQ
ncbi:hypothetical protein KIN20_012565 [Parelaphostrongylus tenuis]|uniref:Uncharacterized protein n=1 Tax=Parelaphostrongylus tenuis TaxID=148309 RepID=A0AAD5MEC5_PARTN|nr:hypothetical protein KIN20_012565 [Parelaphostrongylus tenuis]